ncbi:hypothetical protein KC726_03165 [Candidatus Woesebacteria bacterium]|nr:hypothetical protein [Candidatus Woesebacteria bacterium]
MFYDNLEPAQFVMPRSTQDILALKHINGLPISEIEKNMRPDPSMHYSYHGFLGKDESLLHVLAQDNDTVIRLGLSHNEIANAMDLLFQAVPYPPIRMNEWPRRKFHDFLYDYKKEMHTGKIVVVNGMRFLVSLETYEHNSVTATQRSPMGDNYVGRSHSIRVTNIDKLKSEFGIDVETSADLGRAISDGRTGNLKSIQFNFPSILSYLIRRYEFYEGHQSPYRIGPEEIVAFLNMRHDNNLRSV